MGRVGLLGWWLAAACGRVGFAADTSDAAIDACPATACADDQLYDCVGAHLCSLGCAPTGPPHCLTLAPSNGVTLDLLTGANTAVTGIGLAFDTDSGAIPGVRAPGEGLIDGIGFAVIDRMGVFAARSFAVPAGATWTAGGTNALVLFASTTIDIDGTLDAGADRATAGPGGGAGSTGAMVANLCTGTDGRYKMSLTAGAGAGGGAGATNGGQGGDSATDGAGATGGGFGGVTCGLPSTRPLRGGAGGGASGSENGIVMSGRGGGGGGGVALVALTAVTVNGIVAAPGDGGENYAMQAGGGGGGAGGSVFLESIAVTVSGALTANGGGGGAPANPGATPAYGQRGHLGDATPAAGAIYMSLAGGAGGTGTTAPTNGATNQQVNNTGGGGGGGGAAGAIEVRARSATLTGARTSPTPAQSQAVVE